MPVRMMDEQAAEDKVLAGAELRSGVATLIDIEKVHPQSEPLTDLAAITSP